ncbi:hypothetical protein LAT59_03145 [Candidatus Gracilibacteria bacterium]|nr:hypothetical protein [Candidatus Gracilibacteria bacterium]
MIPYKNINGDSGVISYEYGEDYIKVKFKDNSIYVYTYESAGKIHIDKMKQLADLGQGLNAYINTNVKYLYVKN